MTTTRDRDQFVPWPEGNRDFTGWEQALVRRVRKRVDEGDIGGPLDGEIETCELARLRFLRWRIEQGEVNDDGPD